MQIVKHGVGQVIGLAVVLSALGGPGALAREVDPEVEVELERLSYTRLDLSTESGARVMLKRVRAAATRVCARVNAADLPGRGVRVAECRREVIAAALSRLDAPLVTAEYARTERQLQVD